MERRSRARQGNRARLTQASAGQGTVLARALAE